MTAFGEKETVVLSKQCTSFEKLDGSDYKQGIEGIEHHW